VDRWILAPVAPVGVVGNRGTCATAAAADGDDDAVMADLGIGRTTSFAAATAAETSSPDGVTGGDVLE